MSSRPWPFMSGVRPLSYLLMPNELAKTTALPPKISCQDALSVVTVAERSSNSPSYLLNAQRLGKNGRLIPRNCSKIYLLRRSSPTVVLFPAKCASWMSLR